MAIHAKKISTSIATRTDSQVEVTPAPQKWKPNPINKALRLFKSLAFK